jgi:hypothetical protein
MNIENITNNKLHFILSIERTGSTLLSTMLNMHPNILSTYEEPFAFTLYPKYKNVTSWNSGTIKQYCKDFYLFNEGFLEMQFGTAQDLIAVLEKYKAVLTWDLVFKLTYYNFFPAKNKDEINTIVDKQLIFHTFLEEAAGIYPESKFIVLHRDPRDNALVRWRKARREKKDISYCNFALTWNYTYNRIAEKRKTIGQERFLDVKYEDLVSSPEEELKKICAFLDLPYREIMLSYHEFAKKEIPKFMEGASTTAQEVVTLLHEGLKEKPNTAKVGFWKENLKEEEVNLIWSICGKTAEQIGYKSAGTGKTVRIPFLSADHISFCLQNIFIPRLYYTFPFIFRYWIKKMKYRNSTKILKA